MEIKAKILGIHVHFCGISFISSLIFTAGVTKILGIHVHFCGVSFISSLIFTGGVNPHRAQVHLVQTWPRK